jgi:hypothetical protein
MSKGWKAAFVNWRTKIGFPGMKEDRLWTTMRRHRRHPNMPVIIRDTILFQLRTLIFDPEGQDKICVETFSTELSPTSQVRPALVAFKVLVRK